MVITTKDVVDKLKKSAMFNLSLSSKELFHSNFIDWLISVNKDGMSKVFSNLLRSESEIKIKDCTPEKNNFDLYINCEDGSKLIVENKFKSIITEEQLKKYNEKLDSTTKKLLLSLNSSDHERELSKKYEWRLINYDELCCELNKLAETMTGYHQQLVKDYCSFVKEISTYFSGKDFSKDTLSDMHNEVGNFKKIRLHDIYQKILFNYLSRELDRKIDKSDFAQDHKPPETWSAFSRGTGTVSLHYPLKSERGDINNFRLELQLQYDNLKLMLIHKEPKSLDKQFRHRFFDIISQLANSEKCRKKGELFPKNKDNKNEKYNRYGKNLIYKNIKLNENLNFKDIIDLLDDTFKKIIEFGKKTDKNM